MKHLIKLSILALFMASAVSLCEAQNSSAAPAASPTSPATAQENTNTAPVAPSDKATVYVYRYKKYVGSALEPSVYCDEVQLARMDNGRFFVMHLSPGKHTFRSTDRQTGIEINVEAGREYYIRVDISPGFFKGQGALTLMQNEQGAYEIKKLKPLAASKIKDRTMVVVTTNAPK